MQAPRGPLRFQCLRYRSDRDPDLREVQRRASRLEVRRGRSRRPCTQSGGTCTQHVLVDKLGHILFQTHDRLHLLQTLLLRVIRQALPLRLGPLRRRGHHLCVYRRNVRLILAWMLSGDTLDPLGVEAVAFGVVALCGGVAASSGVVAVLVNIHRFDLGFGRALDDLSLGRDNRSQATATAQIDLPVSVLTPVVKTRVERVMRMKPRRRQRQQQQ